MGKIFALGGGGYAIDLDHQLDTWWLRLAGKDKPKIGLIPTAGGDALHEINAFERTFRSRTSEIRVLCLFRLDGTDIKTWFDGLDIVFVLGGNTANMMAIWKAHQLRCALKHAYNNGVILGGISAGALCWGRGGTTDSFGPITVMKPKDTLGLLPYSICPHYDVGDRAQTFKIAIMDYILPVGYGLPNGTGILFKNGVIHQAVTARSLASVQIIDSSGSVNNVSCRILT